MPEARIIYFYSTRSINSVLNLHSFDILYKLQIVFCWCKEKKTLLQVWSVGVSDVDGTAIPGYMRTFGIIGTMSVISFNLVRWTNKSYYSICTFVSHYSNKANMSAFYAYGDKYIITYLSYFFVINLDQRASTDDIHERSTKFF